MDLETVVKIQGYSVEYQQENDNGQAQSNEINSAVSITSVPLIPGPCGFQKADSTSPTAIKFHPRILSASYCKRIVNSDESPLTSTKDVKGGSSKKEEASAEEKFKCSIHNCSKSFANKHKLNIHLIYDHRKNLFKCHLCESAFPIEFSLKTHYLTTHSTAQLYVCSVCSKICENMEDLREHERGHQITNNLIQTSRSEQQLPLQYSESAQIVMLTLTPVAILPTITPCFSLGATASAEVVQWSKLPTEKSNELVNQQSDLGKQPGKKKSVKTNRKKKEASPEKKFKCSIPNCSKSFANKWKLHAHLKNKHGQNGLFKCHLCGRLCLNKSVLESHLMSHDTEHRHHCTLCSKSFKYIKDLRIHRRKVHQISLSSTEKHELHAHLKNKHSQNKLFKCRSCETMWPTRSALKTHLISHATARSRDCKVCSKSFKSIKDLRIHQKYDHSQNLFECNLCEKAFTNKSSYKNHLATHSTARPFPCNVCFKPYRTIPDLRMHERNVHKIAQKETQKSRSEKQPETCELDLDPLKQPETTQSFDKNRRKDEASAEKKFKCSIPNCSKSFFHNSKLKRHLISHSTARPHHCNVCSKLFKCTKHLRHHKRKVHQISFSSGKRRNKRLEAELVDPNAAPKAPLLKVNPTNKCDICLKAFKSRVALKGHRKNVHTAHNENPHKCHICPLSCVNRSKFIQHLYFVHGEKSEDLKIFKCEFCGREYRSVPSLEAHIVEKHVVDKEFECAVCSKTFVDQETLTKHQVKIHEQTTLISHFCDVCSAGFTSGKILGYHLRNIHKKLYCCKCVRSFENKSEFNQHSNSEATTNFNGGFKLQCQVCFVSLSTQCNFNIHTDGHLREKKSTLVT